MANLGTLTLDLVAKIGGFTGPMDKASRSAKTNAAEIAKAGKVMGAAIGAGAVAAVAGIALIVNSQRDLIDQQSKAAQALDTTYESMAVLERAGDLGGVGIEKITAASRQLNLNLGRAIQGTDAQVEAFDRLGLSAQEIYDLPLDQRIATINKALIDNVQASERAAVAADIFGAKNAKAIQLIDADTIAEAARQVELFGLNLSDIDATKVEMANDALSTFSLLSEGIAKQLTVELAPILQAVGDEFLRAAEKSGGLGKAVKETSRSAVEALAFIIDAGSGVKRVFEIVASAMIYRVTEAVGQATAIIATFNEMVDKVPGVDISSGTKAIREFSDAQFAIAKETASGIQDLLDTPLAGTAFKQFYDDAQAAAQVAAEASVASKAEAKSSGEVFVAVEAKKTKAAKETVSAVQTQITALERAAATWGMSSDEVAIYTLEMDKATPAQIKYAKSLMDTVAGFESAKKAQDDYKSLVSDLRTEEEQLTDQMRERLAVLDAIKDIPTDERSRVAGRIAGAATEAAPDFGGIDASVGGPAGELLKIDDAEEKLQEWYDTQLKMLEDFRAERADLASTWDSEELALKEEHEAALANIEQARHIAQLAAGEEAFGNMADAAKVFFGENSRLYRAAFAVEKAYAIGKALMNVPKSYSDAFAAVVGIPIVGPALAPVAGVAAAAAQVAQAAAIGSIGMAHEGMDSIPKTGSWILEKGERVTTAETSAKLDKTLSDIQSGGTGAPVVNLYEDASKAGTVSNRQENGQNVIDIFVSNIMSDGKAQQAISRKFGIQGVGQ